MHVAIYALILVGLAPFMRLDTPWSVDEGLYVYQVRALQEGGWELDYWAKDIDPAGRWFPLTNHTRAGDSYFPYVRSPMFPLALWIGTEILGDAAGLHALGILGASGAAAAAWLLASRINPRAAPAAFWITALGPVLLYGYAVWAHAPSSAAAGLAVYAAFVALDRGITARSAISLGVGVAAGVLLRTEGLLLGMALAASLGAVAGWRILRRMAGAALALGLGVAAGGTTVVVNALESRWVTSIVPAGAGNDYVRGDELAYWNSKMQGAKHILLDGRYLTSSSIAVATALVVTVAVVTAGVAVRRRSLPDGLGAVGLIAAVAALVIRFAAEPYDTIPGVFPAWPMAVFGLLLVSWRRGTLKERILVGIIALETLATLATQYTEGGGFEWGARYLSPLYPLAGALAAAALVRTISNFPSARRRQMIPLLVALALVPAIGGVRATTKLRARYDGAVRPVEAGRGVVITNEDFLAQVAYRSYPEYRWLRVQSPEIPIALERLAAAGYRDVIVLQPLDAWNRDGGSIPGGYRVLRDGGQKVYLTHN